MPEYKINSSGMKLIVAKYKGKAHQRDHGKRVRVAGFHEYEALSYGSEVEPKVAERAVAKSLKMLPMKPRLRHN